MCEKNSKLFERYNNLLLQIVVYAMTSMEEFEKEELSENEGSAEKNVLLALISEAKKGYEQTIKNIKENLSTNFQTEQESDTFHG